MTEPPNFDWSKFPPGPSPLVGLGPIDFVGVFIPNFSFELQLTAIRKIILRNRKANADLQSEIDQLNKKGKEQGLQQQEIDDYGDLFYEIMYQNSADSLVLSGLMAAFLEEFFTSLYSALSENHKALLKSRRPSDPRWKLKEDEKWRPDVATSKGQGSPKGLAVGIFELARAINLNLSPSFAKLYDALTAYRNAIMHNSLDWSPDELTKFTKQLAERGWNSAWFDVTTTDGDPSMYALTDLFADELMATIEKMFVEVGNFLKVLMS